FFVADLFFISIRRVLPSVAHRVAERTHGVVLLKPQFEAGPANVSRGGIVRDEAVRARVLAEFVEWAGQEGWLVKGSMDSPVPGARGNVEFLIWLVTPNGAGDDRTP
ncbi:MAG: TlyA family rRNA (cytidine-2'-O)-methyltransferase, partial [Dehalococcoidia bacterium]|nr:TlyA family rRNA (cytidine-2'-O)-methyltransferase [Dehalococcoidia bacterium]